MGKRKKIGVGRRKKVKNKTEQKIEKAEGIGLRERESGGKKKRRSNSTTSKMAFSSIPNWTASLRQAIVSAESAKAEGMLERRAILVRRNYKDSISALEVPQTQQLFPPLKAAIEDVIESQQNENMESSEAGLVRSDGGHTKPSLRVGVGSSESRHHHPGFSRATATGTSSQPSFQLPQRRSFAYKQLCAPPMTRYGDNHYLQDLLQWCAKKNVFIHPALEIQHERSDYRDFSFRLRFPVSRHTPLIAVPEELVIGFKEDVSDFDRNALFDAQKETNFFRANHGSEVKAGDLPSMSKSSTDATEPQSDADICDFFFFCLGTIVADLVTAQSSQLTDERHEFAKNLTRIRTLQNAPYLPDNIIFASSSQRRKTNDDGNKGESSHCSEDIEQAIATRGTTESAINSSRTSNANESGQIRKDTQQRANNGNEANKEKSSSVVTVKTDEMVTEEPEPTEECCLADVLLQMIRNYLNGGPLVGKLDRQDLMAAVSMCLSHSTPLVIGPRRSIGIVPLIHLFPHGGLHTNAVVIARPDDNVGYFRELIKAKRRRCTPPALEESPTRGGALLAGNADDENGQQQQQKARPSGDDGEEGGQHISVSRNTHHNHNANISAALEMAEYFTALTGFDFASSIITPDEYSTTKPSFTNNKTDTRFTKGFVYVVALRDLNTGEAVNVQAMAPVCGKEEESSHMWQLSCGVAPKEYLPTSVVAEASSLTLAEILGGVG